MTFFHEFDLHAEIANINWLFVSLVTLWAVRVNPMLKACLAVFDEMPYETRPRESTIVTISVIYALFWPLFLFLRILGLILKSIIV